MSDNFIPLSQSTPVHGKWSAQNHNQRYQNNRHHNGQRRGGYNNRWSNGSQRNNSYESGSNSSYGQDSRSNIDAYLHPSMLQDPWSQLRQKMK
ncbi:uncharacterized protein LOC128200606 [Galleria mellonella]|uniref:Uncharacterized protein LOC128200606 n=1 Tax=Galleria mellonella TaxID=7137 RepID=A0ABM3MGH4_GALME|nr:uncharacterized protein LOC128200606 [Galleria mellonella]